MTIPAAGLQQPAGQGSPASPKVVFILGSQRGGTTILGRLLGEMEGFFFGGEIRRFWRRGFSRPCSCGSALEECPVWSRVLEGVLRGGFRPAEIATWQDRQLSNRHSWLSALRLATDHTLHGGGARKVGLYLKATERLYREIATATGARVIVDSSKHPNDAVVLSQLAGISAHFVQIVRDPRGSVFSTQVRRVPSSRSAALQDTVRASGNWLFRHLAGEALRRFVAPERSLLMSYEALVRRPGGSLQEVADLVGEFPSHLPAFVDHRITMGAAHSPGGVKSFPAGEVWLRYDDRWTTALPRVDAIMTTALTWPLMRRYGYSFASASEPKRGLPRRQASRRGG